MNQRESSNRIDEESFLKEVRDRADDSGGAASAVGKILDWSRKADLGREFACKKRGPQCLIQLRQGLTLLHIEARGARAWLGMQWLRERAPFDREEVQQQLRTQIETLPHYSFGLAGIRGQPRFDLSILAGSNSVTKFIDVMDWMVQRWKASQLTKH